MRFFALIALISIFACQKKPALEALLKGRLTQREGSPSLFFVNNAPYSVDSFRSEVRRERATLRNEFQPLTPREAEAEVQRYIEETIILREAMAQVDFDSAEAQDFMWPYLRQAMIRYYLEKKSGSLDLNKNYQELTIPDDVLKQALRTEAGTGQKKSKVDKEKLLGSAIRLKWEKLHQQTRIKQEALMAEMKQRNKVRLIPQELYKPEE